MLASPAMPARADLRLRMCTSAGEALPREIGEHFAAHAGCEILDGIGSTEMLHIFLSNRAGHVAYGTTGTAVPGYEVELRDENGHAVPDGEIGDLYVRGPSAALMYWCNREKSRATFLGDWLRSGDKYRRLRDGNYVYEGRADDMLKVSGQYVSPVEVEMVLMQHPDVLEAAVVGITRDGLVKTRAFVVVKPGVAATDELAVELKEFVKARMAPHKYPREICSLKTCRKPRLVRSRGSNCANRLSTPERSPSLSGFKSWTDQYSTPLQSTWRICPQRTTGNRFVSSING